MSNPVHDPKHPHHIPHINHTGGVFNYEAAAAAAKALALVSQGVIALEPVLQAAEDDRTDIIVFRRRYLK